MKRAAFLFLTILVAAAAHAASIPGSAHGSIKVSGESTPMRYAWVSENQAVRKIIIADKVLDESTFARPASIAAGAYEADASGFVMQLDEKGNAEEVFFFHPGIPAGLSVRELASFTPRKSIASNLAGRLLFDDPGFSFGFDVTFEGPIIKWKEAVDNLPADATPREHAEWRLKQLGIEVSPSAFRRSVMDGDVDAVKLLLQAGIPVETEDALTEACEFGHPKVAKVLIDAGANVDAADESRQSLVMNAAGNGKDEILKLLIDAGANVNAPNVYRVTPLASAAEQGHLGTVKLLVAAKANVNARDTAGGTALSIAIMRGYKEIVQVLLDAGADLQRDKKDLLSYAKDKPEIQKMIEAALAKSKK